MPDKLVEEFLDEINSSGDAPGDGGGAASAVAAAAAPPFVAAAAAGSPEPSAAPAPSASPKTPPRASQRSAAAAEAPGSPFGPWQGEDDQEDATTPANALPAFPESPFDNPPARDNFPPWYSTPLPGAAKQRSKAPRAKAIAEDARTPLPPSPPFEVEASPPTSLLKKAAGRVAVDAPTTPSTAVKRSSAKRGKKQPVASALASGTPAAKSSASRQRTPGSARSVNGMPSAPSKKKTVSRTMGPRSVSPKSTPRASRAGSAESARPQTAPGSTQRHVSGQSVIYTKLNTPKQRASVRGLGFKKSDPVSMHQQHMKAWTNSSFALGKPSGSKGNRSARPSTAPTSPRVRASEQGFVVPTEKRRDNLRWEIRMQMASAPH